MVIYYGYKFSSYVYFIDSVFSNLWELTELFFEQWHEYCFLLSKNILLHISFWDELFIKKICLVWYTGRLWGCSTPKWSLLNWHILVKLQWYYSNQCFQEDLTKSLWDKELLFIMFTYHEHWLSSWMLYS